MLKNIKISIKNKFKQFKKLKKKLENKDKTIQNQSEDIHFLIDEQNKYRNKCVELERKIKELKNQIKFLSERDNKLQEIEQIFLKEEVDLSKLSRIVDKTRKEK